MYNRRLNTNQIIHLSRFISISNRCLAKKNNYKLNKSLSISSDIIDYSYFDKTLKGKILKVRSSNLFKNIPTLRKVKFFIKARVSKGNSNTTLSKDYFSYKYTNVNHLCFFFNTIGIVNNFNNLSYLLLVN